MAEFAIVSSHQREVSDKTLEAVAGALNGRARVIRPRRDLAIVIAHAQWENVPAVRREDKSGSFVLGPHQNVATKAPSPNSLLGPEADGGGLDWPFVAGAWDDRKIRVIVDPIGARPAWWANVSGGSIVASTPKAVLAHPRMSREPNLGVIAERLTFRPSTSNETIYLGIQLVPAGHSLDIAVGRGPVERSLHRWDFVVAPRSSSVGEIAASIADTTAQVLADEMERRSSETSTLHLSGGLDSSSIAGVFAMQGSDEGMVASMRRFPGLPTDESEYQKAVLHGRRFIPRCIDHVPFDLERDLVEPTRRTALAQIRHDPTHARASLELAEMGRRTAFVGEGGDELYEVIDGSLAGLASGRDWLQFRAHLRDRSPRQHLSEHLEFFPEAVQRTRIQPRSWVRPDFVTQTGLRERIVARTRLGEGGRQKARLKSILETGWYALAAEHRQNRLSELGVEEISVFLHPELVRQAIGVPDALRSTPDDARALQRLAFADVLPQKLLKRRGKVHFDHRHAQDLAGRDLDELLQDMSLHREGFLSQRVVQDARLELLAALRDPSQSLPPLAGPLWATIGLEVWWNTTFDG